jgi:hypothetical protein
VVHPTNVVADVHSDEERPKSPWTPSYGVTTQGPDMSGLAAEDEIVLKQLPPLAATGPAIQPLAEEPTTSSELFNQQEVSTPPPTNVICSE